MRSAVQPGQPRFDGEELLWIEGRPGEQGRQVVVRQTRDGGIEDVTPAGFNARNMVHEYGGGDFTAAGGTVWCPRFEDQRLYRIERGGSPAPITPEGKLRYADLELDSARGRLLCVREDHTSSDQDCVNELVAVPLDGGEQTVIASGRDFYSSPRLSPDGKHLAWLEWDHPLMPWDGAELHLAEVGADGLLTGRRHVAGNPKESIFQPCWSAHGVLYFVSDRTNWWNLYRLHGDEVHAIAPLEAEFGGPQWRFGTATYAPLPDGRIVAAYTSGGTWRLALVEGGSVLDLDLPFTFFSGPVVSGRRLVVLAGSPATAPELIEIDLESGARHVVRAAGLESPNADYVVEPEAVEVPSGDGVAHALLYRPRNPEYEGEGAPPLIVSVHGGPTGSATAVLSLQTLYFTSRGFAVLELNYRGSTGYGRAYRDELYGRWGVIDVEDAVSAARALADRGEADPNRIAVMGGSAGGYTTLAALAFAPGTFRAGVDLFGLSDLRVFDRDTHKFECKYITQLIGGQENYEERSPITKVENINVPLLVLQGLDDRIVPPNQADIIVESLAERGVPHAYIAYEGEGHGFRRAENIVGSLETELAFYGQAFDIAVADEGLPDLDLEPKLTR